MLFVWMVAVLFEAVVTIDIKIKKLPFQWWLTILLIILQLRTTDHQSPASLA